MRLLERDLLYHILCFYCRTKQLHVSNKTRHKDQQWANLHVWPACTEADYQFRVWKYIHECFNFITFQSAMKLHQQGLDCSMQLSLLSGFSTMFHSGHTFRRVARPRIVDGRLFLRFQQWFLFPAAQPVRCPTRIPIYVCPHWEHILVQFVSRTRLGFILSCRASHWDDERINSTCPRCAGLHRCEICPIEFQIDIKNFGEKGIALVVSRWLDLERVVRHKI
jgi:hypothetical protein